MFWHVKASVMSLMERVNFTGSIQKTGYLWHLDCEGGRHMSPLYLNPTFSALEVGVRPRFQTQELRCPASSLFYSLTFLSSTFLILQIHAWNFTFIPNEKPPKNTSKPFFYFADRNCCCIGYQKTCMLLSMANISSVSRNTINGLRFPGWSHTGSFTIILGSGACKSMAFPLQQSHICLQKNMTSERCHEMPAAVLELEMV